MKKIFTLALAIWAPVYFAQTLKPIKKFRTNVPEPSDIAYSADYNNLFIVSDQGVLYRVDTLGKKTAKAEITGLDFEGIYTDDKYVYVADERARRLLVYTQDSLKLVRQNEIAYSGGMNAGYEGMAYNEKKKCFIVVTEKNPSWVFELNNDFVKINEIKIHIASDVSSVFYHKDFMYALSDEDQTVLKLDPLTYKVLYKWKISVTNPEGMAFDKYGNLVIVSDFEQTIFKFQLTENVK